MHFELALFAYIIDRIFGEFSFIKQYKHPVIFMGDYIKWFENKCYKDSVFRGFLLTSSLILIVGSMAFLVDYFIENVFILALIASTGLASKSLYESVQEVLHTPWKIKYLVSRDTQNLDSSDINKAAIETYAENLSDGVIAPLFYLLCFGIEGLFVYKAINTLDSMVGYKNERYEKFGKFSAKLDDVANFIPARITALLIALLFLSKEAFLRFYALGKHHESPNAGLPISAMSLSLGIALGGATSYFGKIKEKPYFGVGRKDITQEDLKRSLTLQIKLDIFLIIVLTIFAKMA
jgi:adenosylcobinamide-phosphate synthase